MIQGWIFVIYNINEVGGILKEIFLLLGQNLKVAVSFWLSVLY